MRYDRKVAQTQRLRRQLHVYRREGKSSKQENPSRTYLNIVDSISEVQKKRKDSIVFPPPRSPGSSLAKGAPILPLHTPKRQSDPRSRSRICFPAIAKQDRERQPAVSRTIPTLPSHIPFFHSLNFQVRTPGHPNLVLSFPNPGTSAKGCTRSLRSCRSSGRASPQTGRIMV